MLSSLIRNWWVAVLRGVMAIGFGAAAFVWPGVTLEILIFLFGAYALVDGISTLMFLRLAKKEMHRRAQVAVLDVALAGV